MLYFIKSIHRFGRLVAPLGSLSALGISLLLAGCASDDDVTTLDDGSSSSSGDGDTSKSGDGDGDGDSSGDGDGDGDIKKDLPKPGGATSEWFDEQTVSNHLEISLPGAEARLNAEALREQLITYDPGSSARCAVEDDSKYSQLIDDLGGVRWGYGVSQVIDLSTPIFQLGYPEPLLFLDAVPGAATADANGGGAVAVEIAEADIVGVGETSALFISPQHGLLMLDLSGDDASFRCAAKLPGNVDQFYLHNGRLVVMVQQYPSGHSHLLHFDVSSEEIAFVESVDLGNSKVLDSRRFNDRLVLYTDLRLPVPEAQQTQEVPPINPGGGGVDIGFANPVQPFVQQENRVLRVFSWGDTLEEELTETHIDDTPSDDFLFGSSVDENTEVGTLVASSSRFGRGMWASDRYFVVTESVTETTLASWETRTYSYCAEGHSETYTYEYCSTEYETRPNPNYVEPDNSGGDRACTGETLATCIKKVAKESAKTIRVPVGRTCEDREGSRYYCDRRDTGSYSFPTYDFDAKTRLYIYEYTEDGFIRFEDEVLEINTEALGETALDEDVDSLPMSTEATTLLVPGDVQSIQFQNGFLYVISEGTLQAYALAEGSLLRTSTLKVSGGRVETTQFTAEKLYLSDAGYQPGEGENSVLRVIDLKDAPFPVQASQDRLLPGGHQSIIPTASGILTTGYVNQFEGESVNMLKVGLFEDPSADELGYLFLGTDLNAPRASDTKSMYYDSGNERLFLAYSGQEMVDEDSDQEVWGNQQRIRIGVSHIEGEGIVSEGAIDLYQMPQRIRPRPGTEEVLSFAPSSIHSLKQGDKDWEATPIFEYFTPTALYRYSIDDDYVELMTLGNRCKLHFAKGDEINDRDEDSVSDAFLCPSSWVRGYGQHLLWTGTFGIKFDEEGKWEMLSEKRATELWEASLRRDVCLYSEDVLEGSVYVDLTSPPDPEPLVCMSSEEYNEATAKIYEEANEQ